ncbi:MAG TPA: ABC transporter permease, partial [Actinomycetota bacterium]|nr:ABC transporter permease [Actinomycetota bacterium]
RPLGAILRALSAPPPGVPVPAGEVRAALTAPRAAAGLELVATFLGPDGRVEARALGSLRPGRQTLRAGPVGGGRLLSLALRAPGIPDLPARLVLAVHRLTVGGEDVGLEGFEPLRWRGSDGGTSGGSSSTIVEIEPGAGHVVGGLVAPSPPLPAVVSPEVRAQLGDRFELGFGVQRVAVEVVAEARAFPTVTPGAPFVVLPAPAVLERAAQIPEPGLELNEVWARGPDPRPALRRAGIRVGGIRRAATIEARLAQLPESLAVGMHFTAAAGGLGLVVIGVAVALSVAQRRREFEFAALRAMGTEPGRIARAMALEQAVLVGYAALAGGGLGWAMLRLMMPILGRSLAARFPEPVLTFDVPTLAAAGIAIAASTAAGLAVAVRAVLRSSVVGVLRGEAE